MTVTTHSQEPHARIAGSSDDGALAHTSSLGSSSEGDTAVSPGPEAGPTAEAPDFHVNKLVHPLARWAYRVLRDLKAADKGLVVNAISQRLGLPGQTAKQELAFHQVQEFVTAKGYFPAANEWNKWRHADPGVDLPAVHLPAVTLPAVPSLGIPAQHIPGQTIPGQHIPGTCMDVPQAFAPQHTTVADPGAYSSIDPQYSPDLSSRYWDSAPSTATPDPSAPGFGELNRAGYPRNQYVRPYMRRDGTQVTGYWRNSPTDGLPTCRVVTC